MSSCLTDLAETLNALLPDCPTGNVCRQVIDTSAGCVQLKHLPVSAPTLISACGGSITSSQYLMDYTSGMLYTCVNDGKILISYRYNLAATYIQQAVRDLGVRLPQRNTACTPLFAHCGLAPLPCSVQRIDWIRVSDCTCGQPVCRRCQSTPRCVCDSFTFRHGTCSLYQRGDLLVVTEPPCEDKMLHICYLGGYPLDKNGCFVGLTTELADLVLLKAQPLAYSNPKLFLDLSGLSSSDASSSANTGSTEFAEVNITGTTTTTSNDTGSEDDAYNETVTVTKTYGTCGKETGSTTTKSGTRNKDKANQATKQVQTAQIRAASVTSQAAASLLSSTQWLSLSRQFQADYEKALLLRTESANIGAAYHRNREPYGRGYRAKIAGGLL
jgi:hypothetical protein